ncbi:MAG: hypothetical protein V1774_01355 [Candidatus Eisenbacteria bacterium]
MRRILVRVDPVLATGIAILVLAAGCAAGNVRYAFHPAGFWAGLWHGAISLVTFVISLFSDTIHMYEMNNAGEWYDGGFLLGALLVWGGIFHSSCSGRRKPPRECAREDIGERIEESIRRGLSDWARESNRSPEEWKEIAGRIEEKIKREIRDWADR